MGLCLETAAVVDVHLSVGVEMIEFLYRFPFLASGFCCSLIEHEACNLHHPHAETKVDMS